MTIFGVKNQFYSIYLLFPQGFPLLDWIPEPKGLVGMTVGGEEEEEFTVSVWDNQAFL